MIAVVPVAVHVLKHRTKPRAYVFRIPGDLPSAWIDRWEGRERTKAYTLSREKARNLYRWLLKIGYAKS